MSGYTTCSVDAVPDIFGGKYPGAMRMMADTLETEQIAFTHRLMPAKTGGKGSYGHRHRTQEEVYYVVSGRLEFKIGDDVLELGAGRRAAGRGRRVALGVERGAGRRRAADRVDPQRRSRARDGDARRLLAGVTVAYHEGSRALQDRFGTRRLADRLDEKFLARGVIDAADRAFIERMDMFFLATADPEGRPDCSYKGGDPGFVRVLDERTIAFPNYDGNGMYRSLGNVLRNPHVGLLFVDFTAQRPSRLRLNGSASIDDDDPLAADYPGAQFVVRVRGARGVSQLPALHPPHGAGGALALRAARGRDGARARVEARRLGARRRALRRRVGAPRRTISTSSRTLRAPISPR